MNTYLELEDKNAMTHGVGCKFCQQTMMEFVFNLRLISEDPIFYFFQIDTIEYFSMKCFTNSLFGD
jgi:hypothetical protein